MILRITRIPAGFDRLKILAVISKPGKLKTHKVVGAVAVLEIPNGTTRDVISLLDRGFTLEVIQW